MPLRIDVGGGENLQRFSVSSLGILHFVYSLLDSFQRIANVDQITLYNTELKTKALFTPSSDVVGMYCCGPTVYNYAHIGNMRTYIFEDILKRVLKLAGYATKHVVNITDVGHLTDDGDAGDDKMEKGAEREGKSVWDIAEHYTQAFMDNIHDLNILDADIWPKATDHISEMITMIQELIDKEFTYTVTDGIYFDSSKFPAYGDFARIDMENLQEGSRVDMGEKKLKTDFALWKFSPEGTKRAMEWESPWGKGFPGWHIECSAMSLKYLGQPLEIHCGGIDHVPIHHTNEIAQVEASTGKKYVNTWIHGEFLVMDNGKMSKSKGGFITVETLKEMAIDPLAYRLYCFSSHYRKQLTFSLDNVKATALTLKKLRTLVQKEVGGVVASTDDKTIKEGMAPFYKAVYDDMNMPRALAWLWTMLKDSSLNAGIKRASLEIAETVFALDVFRVEKSAEQRIKDILFVGFSTASAAELEEIATTIEKRTEARSAKDWATADAMRDALQNLGVEVIDGKEGVECHKK